jgi:hypothetical protein
MVDPSPEEIAAACEAIQAGWSPQTRAVRISGLTVPETRAIRRDRLAARQFTSSYARGRLAGFNQR